MHALVTRVDGLMDFGIEGVFVDRGVLETNMSFQTLILRS
jgi:hypothetical protein